MNLEMLVRHLKRVLDAESKYDADSDFIRGALWAYKEILSVIEQDSETGD